jgi:lysylphosphatidylglycerol synthetase-like protein (DUF2156 family)
MSGSMTGSRSRDRLSNAIRRLPRHAKTDPGRVPARRASPGELGLEATARVAQLRRWLAVAIATTGVFDLITAVIPPSKGQLILLRHFAPLVVAQLAAALLALCGLSQLALWRGLRRGQRQASAISGGLLVVAAVLHLARGFDGVQSAVSLVLLGVLIAKRRYFRAGVDHRWRRSGALLLVGSLATAVALITLALEGFLLLDADATPLPVHQALLAVVERMVGMQTVLLPSRLNRFLSPTLLGVGLALAVAALVVISRPVVDPRLRAERRSRLAARQLVGRHGTGTLDYFALRDDKQHFFDGDTLVPYAVHAGVCLVSPDPIGPIEDRSRAWAAFCRYADAQGWIVAVLGADDSWLSTYRQAGMRSLYIGDEAVVDLHAFNLAGGHKKGLRQAVNRIARYGYTMSFHDPRELEGDLADEVHSVMERSRRGNHERGFSMTLGRLCDPEDAGLLLAVAHDPQGKPVAFCQFVPAPGIGGYSLDLMRRDEGVHPNGLIDFVIVSTIEHLRALGADALGLNFATMRAVLAGEAGDSMARRLQRRALHRLSGSMQIESLWRFSAKYEPEWIGRYLVFGSVEHILAVGLAVARAESWWELPFIGRYLRADHARRTAALSTPVAPGVEAA